MNDNHRKLLQANIDQLAQVTDYGTMIKACVDKEVLTDVMAENIELDGKSDDLLKNEMLFRKLIHRGPTAFQKILEIFQENEFHEAHKLLTSSTVPSSTFANVEVVLDEVSTLSISKTKDHNRNAPHLPPQTVQIQNNGNDDEADAQETQTSNDGPCLGPCFGSRKNKIKPYTEKTSFQIEPDIQVKRAERYGSHPKLQIYNMKSPRRGVLFFVNIIRIRNKKDRDGAEKDRENLITLFREMYYTVFYYEDLTREQFVNLVEDFKKTNYLKSVDSFVFCIHTHGDLYMNQTICEFSDGHTIGVDKIIEIFSNVKCTDLVGKPKVFFFPFCRGTISDRERKIPRIETDGVVNAAVPSFSDILICYGTVPGFTTHRDADFGSWYIRELCKVFAEHACDCHIEELLKMVGSKTLELRAEGRLQVASTESRGFNKLMFFNPLIKEE